MDIGYSPYKGTVDVATISHYHFDHSDTSNLQKDTKIIDKLGSYNLDFVNIYAYPSFHDDIRGKKRGENIIFIYEIDGLKLCHLGDLGHALDSSFIDTLGKIDILFIPVGGRYTLNAKLASLITTTISPSYVLPMHYKTPYLSFNLEGVEKYLKYFKHSNKQKLDSLTVTKDTLPQTTEIILLSSKI